MGINDHGFISDPKQNEIRVSIEIAGSEAFFYTAKKKERDRSNQDTLGAIRYNERQAVLLISDGAGGHPAGDRASQIAVATITKNLHASKGLSSLRVPILDGIEQANKSILDMGVGAACTISVIEVNDQKIRPYHVGDSSILLCGNRGTVKFQTIDHSPAGYALEAGEIDEQEAMSHDERHLLTNVLGSREMKIDVGPERSMRPLDTLVLGSDGLWDNLEVGEVIDYVRKGPLAAAMNRLTKECQAHIDKPGNYRHSKNDDVSIILFRV
jgi:PPM family protein phosphatase